MNKIDILTFELSHIDEVLKIDNMCFSIPWSRESFINEVLENKFARYVVATFDNKIIGYAGMWLIADEAHITNVATHPEYRGIGAASSMFDALLSICKTESITSMTLEVRESNLAALNLYRKYDFIEEGIRKEYYADNKENAIIMWKYNI